MGADFEPTTKDKLTPDHLLQIYREQFSHVRHLENTDMLSFIFVVLLSLGIFAVIHLPIIQNVAHVLGVATIGLIIIGGLGIYATIRRVAYRIRHFAIINRVSITMGAVRAGLIPASLGSGVPGSFGDFWRHLLLGYQGPSVVVYSILMWAIVFAACLQLGLRFLPVPIAIGLGVVFLANLTSAWVSWAHLKQEMLTLKQEMEFGTNMSKSLAEQHCDLADSLLHLRPPRLNEALSHYQDALQIEPGNARAQAAVDKLLNWKVQDYRLSSSLR